MPRGTRHPTPLPRKIPCGRHLGCGSESTSSMKRFGTYLVAAAALAFYLSVGASGLDFTGIDRTVLPGDDFFAYANGAWDKATAIPEDRSVYGVQAIVQDLTRDRIVELIQGTARAGAGADEQMVGA